VPGYFNLIGSLKLIDRLFKMPFPDIAVGAADVAPDLNFHNSVLDLFILIHSNIFNVNYRDSVPWPDFLVPGKVMQSSDFKNNRY
jgi:hypothetical protein